MIYCPNCGTANRDGSKFCNRCGYKLGGASQAICPSCGAANPIENMFCDACGSKLAPLVTRGAEEKGGVKGLSLPTKAVDEDGEDAVPGSEDVSGPADEEAGEIPDWMREIGKSVRAAADSAEAEMAAFAAKDEPKDEAGSELPLEDAGEIPDWMRGLGRRVSEQAAQAETEAAASGDADALPEDILEEGEEPEEEAPAWLAEMRASARLADVSAEEAEEPAAEWLSEPEGETEKLEEGPAEEPTGVAEEPLLVPEEEVEPLAAEAASEEAAGPQPEELPEPEAVEAAETMTQAVSEEEAPDEAAAPSAGVAEEPEEPFEGEPAEQLLAEEAEPGPWPEEEGPLILEPEGELEEETIVFRPEETTEALAPGELPVWLESLAPEGALLGEEMEAGRLTPEEAGLEPAEIPEWLEALRSGRPRPPEIEPEEPVEETGILRGIRGPLALVQAIDPTPAAQIRPMSEPVAASASQAELFTNLLAEPLSSLIKPKEIGSIRKKERGLPWLASLLLLAAVLIPFFVTGFLPETGPVAVPQSVTSMAEAVAGLGTGDIVLLSFDYDPGTSTELDRPVRAVLDDLSARGVRFLTMGTTPTGPGLAARFDLPADRTLSLGYLPGQDMGLRRLALGTAGLFPAGEGEAAPFGVQSLDDVALILTFTASQDTIRGWVEQVGLQIDAPIGAVVSAAIEPTARPYYASKQLVGLVAGWVGGQAYREAAGSGASDELDAVATEAQSLAHLAIAVLIVLANIFYWAKRLFGGRP